MLNYSIKRCLNCVKLIFFNNPRRFHTTPLLKCDTPNKSKYNTLLDYDWKFIETNFKLITNQEHEKLKQTIKKEYIDNPNCVYCIYPKNREYYFIVMEKLPNNKDVVLYASKMQTVYDEDYTLYISKSLLVKQIIRLKLLNETTDPNIKSLSTVSYPVYSNWTYEVKRYYEVGKIISGSNFEERIMHPYNFIYYYKTIHAALFGSQHVPDHYMGLWFYCSNDGKIRQITEYNNGEKVRILEFGLFGYNYATLQNIKKFNKFTTPELISFYYNSNSYMISRESVTSMYFNL